MGGGRVGLSLKKTIKNLHGETQRKHRDTQMKKLISPAILGDGMG